MHKHKYIPVLIILIGALFILESLRVLTPEFVATTWPILVVLAGLGMLRSHKKGESGGGCC